MLTLIEKILFAIAVLASLYMTYVTFGKMAKIVLRGQGQLNFDELPKRMMTGFMALITQGRIIRHRKISSLFHYFVAWGFIYYILVNALDVLEGSGDHQSWSSSGRCHRPEGIRCLPTLARASLEPDPDRGVRRAKVGVQG